MFWVSPLTLSVGIPLSLSPIFTSVLFQNQRSEESNQKVYIIDSGWRHRFGFWFSKQLGKLTENVVAIILLQRSDRYFLPLTLHFYSYLITTIFFAAV